MTPFIAAIGSEKQLGALQEVRNVAVPGEFKLATTAGGALDHGKVNVIVQRQARSRAGAAPSSETLAYQADRAKCDAVAGGWYYDRDPASCDSTCRTLETEMAQADLVFGCKTLPVE